MAFTLDDQAILGFPAMDNKIFIVKVIPKWSNHKGISWIESVNADNETKASGIISKLYNKLKYLCYDNLKYS